MNRFLKWAILILFASMIIIMIAVNVRADDWQLSANLYKTIASDVESIVQSGSGIQLSLHRKNLYLYLSQDKIPVRFAGQNCVDIRLRSIGLGFQHEISKHLTFSCDAGIYFPHFKESEEPQIYPETSFSEGLCRYLNKFLSPDNSYPAWNYYTLDYERGYGGKIGLDFQYPLTKRLSIDLNVNYRYLRLEETIQGKNWDHNNPFWTTNFWIIQQDRDFSGWMIGGSFTVEF